MFRGLLRHLQGELFCTVKSIVTFCDYIRFETFFYIYIENLVCFSVELQMLKSLCKVCSSTMQQTPVFNVNKNPTDATVCRYLFTAKLLYMFRVSQHPSSGVLKTVPAASCTGHTTCTATPLQRGLIGTGWRGVAVQVV